MSCGVAGFLLSGEKVVLDELSQKAIPDELLVKLLAEKAAVPGDTISWEVIPEPSDIKKYVGGTKCKLSINISLKVILGDYVLVRAHWHNKE